MLLLYLKLFTFLEIIKLSFDMLNVFISSCSAQVTILQELQSDLKNLLKVKKNEILEKFKNVILIMSLMLCTPYGLYLKRRLSQAKKNLKLNIQKTDKWKFFMFLD